MEFLENLDFWNQMFWIFVSSIIVLLFVAFFWQLIKCLNSGNNEYDEQNDND
jgi:heme/copper-type cytochrome/quinol oxidase subunit 2